MEKVDHTEGSIIKSVLRMGLPSMIGFAAGNIYDLADMFWVAKLGAEQVAAITIFSAFYWVISAANQLAGTGSVALISRRYGEKDYHKTEAVIKETFILKWLIAIFFGTIGYFLVDKIMFILGARGEVIDLGISYGKIRFLGLGFALASFSVYTALRSVADPNKAMLVMIGSFFLNIVLDPFLIFGWWIFPEMGIEGAALASIISYATAFLVGLFIFYGGKTNVKLHLAGKVGIKASSMIKMLKIGLPSGIGSISFALSRVVVMPLVAVFGTGVVAAYGVGARVIEFGIMVIVGIGLGLSSLIGHNLGAGKLERAKKTANQAILLNVTIMIIFSALVFILAPHIIGFFFKVEEYARLSITLLRILCLSLPFVGIFITIEEIYAGAGNNLPSMVFGMIYSWVLEIPLILILTRVFYFNQNGVWWAIVIAHFIGTALFYFYFRRGKWLHRKV